MIETVKRYGQKQAVSGNYTGEVQDGDYVLYSDYAALSKRLAETEAIAKDALSKAPAYAEEARRMGAEVVRLTGALKDGAKQMQAVCALLLRRDSTRSQAVELLRDIQSDFDAALNPPAEPTGDLARKPMKED